MRDLRHPVSSEIYCQAPPNFLDNRVSSPRPIVIPETVVTYRSPVDPVCAIDFIDFLAFVGRFAVELIID